MKVKKVIEVRLDIKEPSDIYCANYDEKVIQLLAKKFVGKCYKSIFILKVNKILRRSAFKSKQIALDGSLYTDVQFEVDAIVYEKGDVIHNCKIIQINNNNTMHAKSKYASLYIKNLKNLTIFKEGDEIIVIVDSVKYTIGETEISVLAYPLKPTLKSSVIYNIQNTDMQSAAEAQISNEYIKNLNAEIKSLDDKLMKLKKSHVKSFEFFSKLLYPYKEVKKELKFKKSINILNIDSEINNILMNNESLHVYSQISLIYLTPVDILSTDDINTIKKSYPATSFIDITKDSLIIQLMSEHRKKLNIFIDFVETYNNADLIKQHSPSWLLYNTQKM